MRSSNRVGKIPGLFFALAAFAAGLVLLHPIARANDAAKSAMALSLENAFKKKNEKPSGCSIDFALLGAQKAILPEERKLALRVDRDRLRGKLQRDLESAELATVPGDRTIRTARLGEDTHEVLQKMTVAVKADLEAQGFTVRTTTRPPIEHFNGSIYISIPEREVLLIESSSAKGPFARELKRLEDYTNLRKNDPSTPEAVRALDFTTSYDPGLSAILESSGHFTVGSIYGTGMNLSTLSFLSGTDVTQEIMRHEIRHAKTYFDIVSKKETPFQGRINNRAGDALFKSDEPRTQKVLELYERFYSFDEINGFLENVRIRQIRLGQETEAMAKRLKSNEDITGSDLRAFKKNIASIQADARVNVGTVRAFTGATLENVEKARSVFKTNSSMTDVRENVRRISAEKRDAYPGFTEITYDLSRTAGSLERMLVIYVPNGEAEKALQGNTDFLMNHLDKLEAETRRIQKQLEVRSRDIERDRYQRLMPAPKP